MQLCIRTYTLPRNHGQIGLITGQTVWSCHDDLVSCNRICYSQSKKAQHPKSLKYVGATDPTVWGLRTWMYMCHSKNDVPAPAPGLQKWHITLTSAFTSCFFLVGQEIEPKALSIISRSRTPNLLPGFRRKCILRGNSFLQNKLFWFLLMPKSYTKIINQSLHHVLLLLVLLFFFLRLGPTMWSRLALDPWFTRLFLLGAQIASVYCHAWLMLICMHIYSYIHTHNAYICIHALGGTC